MNCILGMNYANEPITTDVAQELGRSWEGVGKKLGRNWVKR